MGTIDTTDRKETAMNKFYTNKEYVNADRIYCLQQGIRILQHGGAPTARTLKLIAMKESLITEIKAGRA
jgi:hypothetical protein